MSRLGKCAQWAISILALMLLFVACNNTKNRNSFVGTFTTMFPNGYGKATLRSDGTFDQQIVLNNPSRNESTTGTWSFDAVHKDIIFDGFLNPFDGFGKYDPDFINKRGVAVFPLEPFSGISFGSYEGFVYKKDEK